MDKSYILDNNTKLDLGEGPTLFHTYKTDQEKVEMEIRRYARERAKFCCSTCGIYLEQNERKTLMKCNICFQKLFPTKHYQYDNEHLGEI